jgi:hypothetical protein
VTLLFHREIYDGKAVDAAVKQYGDYAEFELVESPDHWIVSVTAGGKGADEDDLRALAGELGNYALGLTIQQRGAQ